VGRGFLIEDEGEAMLLHRFAFILGISPPLISGEGQGWGSFNDITNPEN
jgi:hypothetical protein